MDAVCGSGNADNFRDVCLVQSLGALGVPIVPTSSGPFRPLAHGNRMLAQFDKELKPCLSESVGDGLFVFCTPSGHTMGHAVGIMVSGGRCTRFDGDTVDHPDLDALTSMSTGRWFRLVNRLSPEQQRRLEHNRHRALRRRTEQLARREVPPMRFAVPAWPEEAQQRFYANRQQAISTRAQSLIRTLPPLGCQHLRCPVRCGELSESDINLPPVTFLAKLNEHVRDHRLQFFVREHRYCIDGVPTLGSVSGLPSCLF